MEEVIKVLTELVKQELDECKSNKKVPSKELLDTINTLNIIIHSY